MIIVDLANPDKIINLTNPYYYSLHSCIEELLLWQGENPMDIEAGIDYKGVFNKQKFFKNEITRVLDKYRGNFLETQIQSIDYNEDKETAEAVIILTLENNNSLRISIDVVNKNLKRR